MQVQSPGREDPLQEETTTHSSIFAWRIHWMDEFYTSGTFQFTLANFKCSGATHGC